MALSLNRKQAMADDGQAGVIHDGGVEVVLHESMIAAFVLILRDLRVSVVKNHAKRSQTWGR